MERLMESERAIVCEKIFFDKDLEIFETYLGRPGELEEVDHVLLVVLHVGQRLLWFGLGRLFSLLWLLLLIFFLLG